MQRSAYHHIELSRKRFSSSTASPRTPEHNNNTRRHCTRFQPNQALSSLAAVVIMSERNEPFHDNQLYQLLIKQPIYSNEVLQELNAILHQQPELATLNHPVEGTYLHIVCRKSSEHENVAYRMIYALSNAGADPNVTNEKGNTPLHEALIHGFMDIGLELIQALFRVGVDPRIENKEGKKANAYLNENPQLIALYDGYAEGIWTAVEMNNVQETERLTKGFIKIDCKHNGSKTLLDKARESNFAQIIRILADYQVTIEFVHSILACDWERASLIHQYEGQFIKLNVSDSVHTFTWARTSNRTYSKSVLEVCLDTKSLEPFELIFNSAVLGPRIDVNVMCTDGLPFFFHVFEKHIPDDIQKQIFAQANFNIKSSTGETLLFHLIHLYDQNENKHYLDTFKEILLKQPLLLTQRNEQGRTIVDDMEFTPALSYNKLRVFYDAVRDVLVNEMKNNLIIERCVLNGFGYHLLLFFNDDQAHTSKFLSDLLRSLKLRQGLPALMLDLAQGIANDDLGKVQHILKARSNINVAKDWSGRACTHLAVLYRRRRILSFICENYPNVINAKDNLNRTALHYACIMKDETTITILQQANAKKTLDCLSLFPSDYKTNSDLCCEEFHSCGFPKNELEKRLSGIGDYLKLSFYFPLKKSIEDSAITDLKSIHDEMNAMGFNLDDFSCNSYLNDWVHGQRYIPLLFIALEHRSTTAVQCLIELGLPLAGRMYISKSVNNTNSRCVSFRTRAEELECFDIIGMINDLEDDNELKSIFKRHMSAAATVYSGSSTTPRSQSKRQKLPVQETVPKLNSSQNTNSAKSQACIIL